jgi:hypothetical protein
MDYNTQRKRLLLPEYGRHIQTMVDHLATIENREERSRVAKSIIGVMGNLYPNLRDVPDFRHKLWDHLTIMAGFSLDIDAPYPLPSREKFEAKPDRIPYPHRRIRFKHYGLMTERLVQKIKEFDDEEQRRVLIVLTTNYMKKLFLAWNKDSVEDAQIFDDFRALYGEPVEIPEGLVLSSFKEVPAKKTGKASNPPGNKPQGKNNGSKKPYYKKQHA